jgi:hypothetical protein
MQRFWIRFFLKCSKEVKLSKNRLQMESEGELEVGWREEVKNLPSEQNLVASAV